MCIGEKEDEEEMSRSTLAQMEYSYQICKWDDDGIPFRTYMYVLEKHPLTGSEFHEREDFAHVLKVHVHTMDLFKICFKFHVVLLHNIISKEWLKVQGLGVLTVSS